MGRLPLEGVKVADFCWVWTGPTTTKVLADFGATVVKIESNRRLETWRIQPPFKDNIPGPNRGAIFNSINTSKRSVTINLAHPKGLELAKKFVAWADVVTENYAGGSMERMGLGYEVLRQIKPDIIMLSSALMGQTGPWHNSPGYGDQLTAISGMSEISGWPDRIPGEVGFYTDYVAPRFNALTVLAALDYRRRTGKGVYLDIAQHQSSVHFIAPVVLDYVVNKRVASRQGNEDDYAAPHGTYPCKGVDRWCAVAVFTDEEWQKFCQVIGQPAWTKDPRFATLQARKENEEELNTLVAAWTVNYTDREVMTRLQTAGVPAGLVANAEDQMEHDPQLKYRHFYWELEHPEIGKYRAPRQPCVLSKTPCEIRRAPLIGEHTEATLKEILGMSDEDIAQLVIEGVLE
jgi:benzylsuccinate CoA-transferase BbsF subunit